MKPMNARKSSALVLFALIVTPLPAIAAPASATSSVRDGLPTDAQGKFDDASRLYREARYTEARELFLSAYATSGEPRVLFNVAVCDKALGRYARAIATLKRSLVTTDRALPAEYADRVREAIATLSRYVAFVRVASSVEGVVFIVDGEAVRENPVALETGSHTFVATKDGYEPATTTISVTAGEAEEVTLDPEPSTRPGVAKITCVGVRDCEIRVGDELVGKAPVTVSRSAGSFLVRAKVEGREWSQQRIDIQNGKTLEVALIGRVMPTAHLRVTTDRGDDTITVDGLLVGRSGIGIELTPGEHRLFIARKDGGASRSLDILLHENETRDLRVVLEEKKGISPWWFVGGAALLAGAITTAAIVASQPTTFEGSSAGTLNPFVVPASRGIP